MDGKLKEPVCVLFSICLESLNNFTLLGAHCVLHTIVGVCAAVSLTSNSFYALYGLIILYIYI